MWRLIIGHPQATRQCELTHEDLGKKSMTLKTRTSVPWSKAFNIAERLELKTENVQDENLAAARWAMWQSLPVFRQEYASDDVRLSPLGVTGAGLKELLGRESETGSRGEPEWHVSFWSFLDRCDFQALAGRTELGLAEIVRPLVDGGIFVLQERLARATAACADSDVRAFGEIVAAAVLRVPPIDMLSDIVTPTMVLEINVAREEQRLRGDTPEARYLDFVEKMHDRDVFLDVFAEYPVMARLCVERLIMWQDRMTEFLAAVLSDFEDLRGRFWDGSAPETVNVLVGAGDSHNEGRSVVILETSIAKVVFKPRNCRMDEGFTRFVDWFNTKCPSLGLRTIGMISRRSYGWFEFVAPEAIENRAAAGRYSRRLGMLTALFYVLRATDFHHENIVATGEHPLAVDLEALFHAERATAASNGNENLTLASQMLSNSVMSTGVVPNRIFRGNGSDIRAVDVSAAGARGEQLGIVDVPSLQMRQTDEVHIVPTTPTFTAESNAPSDAEGVTVDVVAHAADFIEGFREAYRIVVEGRDELLEPGGVLDGFAGAESRLIARPTVTYAKLLIESFHPDFLRQGIDRDLCLSKLLGGYEGTPHRASMLASEIAELRIGDIPAFFVNVDADDVRAGSARNKVGYVGGSPLMEVRRFLETTAGGEDLSQQLQILRLAFEAARLAAGDGMAFAGRQLGSLPPPFDDQQRLECAVNLSNRILDLAAERSGELGWVGLSFVGEKWWAVTPTGTDLYNGTSGIALALSTVGDVAKDDRATEAALRLFEQLLRHTQEMLFMAESMASPRKALATDTGAFGALSGPIYALSHASVRYGREDFAAAAAALSRVLPDAGARDENFDIVSGNAGGILGQLALYEATGLSSALERARELANRLCSSAVRTDDGFAWKPKFNSRPLVGLSHGASGIAMALGRLRAADRTIDVEAVIHAALRYERRHRLPLSGDWTDLRDSESSSSSIMRAWCHGSPGAALVRHELMKLEHLKDDAELLEQMIASLKATGETLLPTDASYTGIGNHSICHGDIGNLLSYEEALKNLPPDMAEELSLGRQPWDRICHSGSTQGWLCGIPTAEHVPGLMTGLAGIAWGLAYSVASSAEPNLLTLEGPHRLLSGGRAF